MKVLAAMSGGVDSAVATARAVEAGHDVGVHLVPSKNPELSVGARAAAPRRMPTMLGGSRVLGIRSTAGICRMFCRRCGERLRGRVRAPHQPVCAATRRSFSAVLTAGRALLGFDGVCMVTTSG
jgi:tRNA-specific 2-thiouridylase